ncbi:conserved Plasmodium protein, unknown function [Plasmodium vivax]|uniref:Uncharacterized protein n=4 Tax=Plasmodium vivax TaxID=5855 RepID=A5K290_PLAVS|nr:hypothetical protein, conserved [Plasmodium vivax]KMZ79795.1 hypothetical protein PVIIG_01069 [Plasmodium vivax India VII]KMZ98730.1 hypothetical protein PVNG_03590 [Plasmodium vivax North Korean]EDL46540.1 hypothetical protein, conserved [Plasmodium vivax]CAG9477837.1 unnamed protein product [Plasmodium vivax]SCO73604.1 conserved Plasmodium protein, unknown function [Plasmodium vivax]|eukprot:XP_001616267.1 hypothetical protein [Plasmodium vivax Sal-1]
MQNAWHKLNKAMQNIQNVILTEDDSLFVSEKGTNAKGSSASKDEDDLTKGELQHGGSNAKKVLSQAVYSVSSSPVKAIATTSGTTQSGSLEGPPNAVDRKNALYEEIVNSITLFDNLMRNEKVQLLINEYQIDYYTADDRKKDFLLLNFVYISKYMLLILTKFLNISLLEKMEFTQMSKEEYEHSVTHLFLNILKIGNFAQRSGSSDPLSLHRNYNPNWQGSANSSLPQQKEEEKEGPALLTYKGAEQGVDALHSAASAADGMGTSAQGREETVLSSHHNAQSNFENANEQSTHYHQVIHHEGFVCSPHLNKREEGSTNCYQYNTKSDHFNPRVDGENGKSGSTEGVVGIAGGNEAVMHRPSDVNNNVYNSPDKCKNCVFQNGETSTYFTKNHLAYSKSMDVSERDLFTTELHRRSEFFPKKSSLIECREEDFCISEAKIDLKNIIKSMKEENNVKIDLLNDKIKYLEAEIIKSKERLFSFQELEEDVEKYKREINSKNKIIEEMVREKDLLQNDISVMQTKLEHTSKFNEDRKKLTKYCQENHVDKQIIMEMLKNSRDSLKASNIKNQVFLILCDILGIKNIIEGVAMQEKTISDQFLEFLDEETKDP